MNEEEWQSAWAAMVSRCAGFGWRLWPGVNGKLYAARENSSPPVVLHDDTMGGLEQQIRDADLSIP